MSALLGCKREPPLPAPTKPIPLATAPSASQVPIKQRTRRFAFPVGRVHVSISDVHMSKRFDEVLAQTSALLVVNGGFFGPEGAPIGLAISNGITLSAFSPAMSGGVLWIKGGLAHLTATEDYRSANPDFAIQCRPRLIVDSKVNIRGDDGHDAPRTAICLRDGGRTIEFVIADNVDGDQGPSLLELARELSDLGCEEALNLDGGPSTGWASRGDAGISFAPPRGSVRHAVVVSP